MKVAMTIWDGRISPVFDTARSLVVLEVEGGSVLSRRNHEMGGSDTAARVAELAALGVDTLICGAVSEPVADLIFGRDIRLSSFVAGDEATVLGAFLAGRLEAPELAMPGCCGRRRRFRGGVGGCGRGRHRRPGDDLTNMVSGNNNQ